MSSCACRIVAQCRALRDSDTAHSESGDAEISQAHLCRQRRRLWDWSSQSRRSAVLKGHCWLALAQHASAVRRRRHLLTERMRDAAQGRVTHGATAAPAPRLGSLGSPCTCTMVHLGSSAPNCTVHLGASELMSTRIKVRIRPVAPNRTVHLGASERLTVCVAQPGNGYTSARIAAETFRLQLSYTKIKSG